MATLEEIEDALRSSAQSGDTETQQRLSDAMRAHPTFQENAKEKLDSGLYKIADDGYTQLGKDDERANMSKYIARSLGLDDSDVDVTQGMGLLGRASLSFDQTDKSKFKTLESRYGRENIQAIDVGGKQKLLYRDEKETGGKYRAVDEEGISIADFFGDTAGSVLPVGAAIGAAVATGGASIPVMAAAAAGASFFAGAGQDIASRAIKGKDIDLGEIGGRRLKEAAIGGVYDVGTMGFGRFVGKPLMQAIGKTPRAQGIMDSMQALKGKFGLNLQETPSMTKGLGAQEKAARVAGETGGALTRKFQSNIDEIGRASRVVDGTELPTTAQGAIGRMQARVKESYDADISDSARLGGEITEAYKTRAAQQQQGLQAQLDNEVAGLRIPRDFDPEVSAGNFRGSMLAQKGLVGDASRAKFEKGLGNMEKSSVSASDLQEKLGSTVDALKGVESDDALISGLSSSKVTQLGKSVSKLEEMAASGERIPFRSLHNLKKSLDDASGFGSASVSDNQLAARRAGAKVRELMDESLKGAGSRGKAYGEANKFFQDRMLPFRDKSIAPFLASDISPNSFKQTGTQLAKKVVSDPEYVREILKNAGGSRAVAKKEMGKMYLDSVGTSFDVNNKIASQLFPPDVVSSLNRIRALKEKLKVPARKINEGDFRAMVNGMSGKARKEAEKALEGKIKAEARASANIKSNKLVEKIAAGTQPMPSNPRAFADDVLKESSDTIGNFVGRLGDDPDALSSLRAGVIENFREAINFGGKGAQKTSEAAGETILWKSGDVEKLLSSGKGEKYRAAMGDDWVKNWIDMDRALSGSQITGKPIKEQVRAVFTTGSGLLLVAAGVPKWIYGKALNALGGSSLMAPFLRNVQNDPAAMKNLIPFMLSSSEGIQALLEEGQEDPQFAEWVDSQLSDQGSQQPQEALQQ